MEKTKLVQHAQVHATHLIKRRWVDLKSNNPVLDIKTCVDKLIEMGLLSDMVVELSGKKSSLIFWYVSVLQSAASREERISAKQFYKSYDWRRARLMAIEKSNKKCGYCGASAKNGAVLHVDHIMPRSRFPELSLQTDNLQVLCEDCNMGKGEEEFGGQVSDV